MRKKNIILTVLFVAILILPALDMYFHFSPVKELFEKRLPAQKPEFTFSENFAPNFEKYFNDNYGFRKSLISWNSKLMDKFFNQSPDSRAVIGKDGWFYFDNYNSLLDAQGALDLPDEMVNRGVKAFYQNWQILRKKNINYLLVIAPDKSTIYPEFLPDYIKPGNKHRIDKFLAALKKSHPDFPVIDLRPVLLEAKKYEIVYHKTDTHWNRRGAHYAYVEIFKKLGIKPHFRDEFSEKEDEMIVGDISKIMGVKTKNLNLDLTPNFPKTYKEIQADEKLKNFHRPFIAKNKDSTLPVLFAFKDSFFGDLTFYFTEHFSSTILVNEFPCDLNYNSIKNLHPNLVIQEFWEGRVEDILSRCK